MIEMLPIDSGRLVAMRAIGKLTHEDYRDVAIPRLEQALKEHDKLRFLAVFGDDYDGITPAALWDDLKFDVAHRKDFERIAIVTDGKLMRAVVRMSNLFFRGEVRVYDFAHMTQAQQWVQEGLPAQAPSQ